MTGRLVAVDPVPAARCNTSSPLRVVGGADRLRGCRKQACVITVVDPAAARLALTAGQLSCTEPGFVGVLRVWSRARARQVRRPGGVVVRLPPDRARCRSCRVTHVLLPAWCVPRCSDDVEVVGGALLAAADGTGHRQVAAVLGVPAGTVRGWLRAVRAGTAALTAQAVTLLEAAGASLFPAQRSPGWVGQALPEAVHALGAAAQAFTLHLAVARAPGDGGSLTGIDYLGLLAEQDRRQVQRRLRLVDPTGAAGALRGWQLLTVITGGRLLTMAPAS